MLAVAWNCLRTRQLVTRSVTAIVINDHKEKSVKLSSASSLA